MTDQGKQSQQGFHVKKFASVGMEEEFVRHTLDLVDVLGATEIMGQERREVESCLGLVVTEGLIPAFMKLREIRAAVGKDIPVLARLMKFLRCFLSFDCRGHSISFGNPGTIPDRNGLNGFNGNQRLSVKRLAKNACTYYVLGFRGTVF